MCKIKRENYLNIQGWMVTDLKLKGNDLLIYALIYGFTQDGEQWFEGSRQYLADWCNSTKRGIVKNLQSLVEKGYLLKKDVVINDVKFCRYRANMDWCTPGEQSSSPPVNKVHHPDEQSSPNNKDNNKYNNITEEKKIPKKRSSDVSNDLANQSEFSITEEETVIEKITAMSDKEMSQKLLAFFDNRKRQGKPINHAVLQVIGNRLKKFSDGNRAIMLDILDRSISGGYTDVYPPKEASRKPAYPSCGAYDINEYEETTSDNYADYLNSMYDTLVDRNQKRAQNRD